MSFSSEKTLYYFIYHLNNWFLIIYVKTLAINKYYQFDNSNSEENALKIY